MAIVWVIMNILAEIVVYLPLKGATIPYFVERFVEPSLAFAAGWNYWYAYAILVAAEASAGAIILDYWKTAVPTGVWSELSHTQVFPLPLLRVMSRGE